MATNLEVIKGYLDENNIKYRDEGNFLTVVYETENYTNFVNGEKSVLIIITTETMGHFVQLWVSAYRFSSDSNSYNKLALLQTLLKITYDTKLLQFEYDPDDGEVRLMVDIPVMDSNLTALQLIYSLKAILRCLDSEHQNITDAMRHGLTPESDSERLAAWEEFKKERAERRRREFGN
jgi:hypothetical protein